ncbi:hypothetical protein M9Y10_008320 [Tritrichomonas musculus]|uniref:Uncharacterized protein n=1 Tax=Tritrichomonas musculus TaxID=1915356 RepID=A0ABR2IXX8_9EUKA
MNNFISNQVSFQSNLKENYFIEAIFAIANDFDRTHCNTSTDNSTIPEMINVIGKNSFERCPETIKNMEKEMYNLFLNENDSYFCQNTKEDESIDSSNFNIQPFATERSNSERTLHNDSIGLFNNENITNEFNPFYNTIDKYPYIHENKKDSQYEFQFLAKNNSLQFKDTHIFSFFPQS